MATKKPTTEQIFVLRKLAADYHEASKPSHLGGRIAYYRGGFWASPGQEVRHKLIDRVPNDWYTSRQTVDAMERRGWLRRLDTSSNYDIKKFPDLPDRQITTEGLEVAADAHEEPQRFDPDDGKIHVRTGPLTPTAKPVLCGRTGAASVSSASGFWGPEGRGFPDVCPKCYEVEHKRPKLVTGAA